jgi:protein transport protein SEC13
VTLEDGQWDSQIFVAHQIGCNTVSWYPSVTPMSLLSAGSPKPTMPIKKLATGGCDNLIKIWVFKDEKWEEEGEALEGHSDWVRDVAFAPNIGASYNVLASCSQDKKVIIWYEDGNTNQWTKKELPVFNDALWRVSWSITGQVLAVSCGDNKVTLWKEDLKGDWECISQFDENQ